MLINSLPPLRPYQKEGVQLACQFLKNSPGHAAYNGSDPRLGKTRMSIETCKEMGFKKILVICPATIRLTWAAQFEEWDPQENRIVTTVLNTKELENLPKETDICIISYDLVARNSGYTWLLPFQWDVLILDEVHYLMSQDSARTKLILGKIWPRIPYRIVLSGTPFLSSIVNVYPVFNACLPETFGDFDQFANKFAQKKLTPYGMTYPGVKNPKLLSTLIHKHFFFRFRMTEVVKDLPPIVYQKIVLPHSASVSEYEAELQKLVMMPDGSVDPGKLLGKVPPHFPGLRRLQGQLKVTYISEYVRDLLEQKFPVVLFCWHTEVISDYTKALSPYNPGIIQGATSPKGRQDAIDNFQSGKTDLIIAQLVAGGFGINLSRGNDVIHAELDSRPAVISQATKRVVSVEKKESISAHYFVVAGSCDEQISRKLIERAETFSKVIQ